MSITTRPKTGTKNRGFAAMDPERQRAIARRGGRAAHEKGTAHQFNSREAQLAGRKGGRKVSQNRRHMAEIGKKGGESGGRRALENVRVSSRSLSNQKAAPLQRVGQR